MLLKNGEVTSHQLIPRGSNYTFLVTLRDGRGAEHLAVYKPRRGEAPLWDFLDGTLYLREYATYVVAEALSWHFVPLTIIRDGPYGIGSMQLFMDHHPRENYFTLSGRYIPELQRICLFDLLSNNADRKGGHCLLGTDGRIWGIDHGLTFNAAPKLRTVIWDFAGEPVASKLLADMEGLLGRLESQDGLATELQEMLLPTELEALKVRLSAILQDPCFPSPYFIGRRTMPWPPF